MKQSLKEYIEVLKSGNTQALGAIESDLNKVMMFMLLKQAQNAAMLEVVLKSQANILEAMEFGTAKEISAGIEEEIDQNTDRNLAEFLVSLAEVNDE